MQCRQDCNELGAYLEICILGSKVYLHIRVLPIDGSAVRGHLYSRHGVSLIGSSNSAGVPRAQRRV